MNKEEVSFNGSNLRIYSGNYLMSLGYDRAFKDKDGKLIIETTPCRLRKGGFHGYVYLRPFSPREQLSSMYKRWHHSSDIHAIFHEYLIDVDEYKKGYFYIPAANTDYFKHNRTDQKRYRELGLNISRGPAPEKLPIKVISIIGTRPKGDPENFNIYNDKVYGPIRKLFGKIFRAAKDKYGKKNVCLLTNGAIGFQQLAQDVAINEGIQVWLHIPFSSFSEVWKKREIKRFIDLAKDSFLTDLGYGTIPEGDNRIMAIKEGMKRIIMNSNHLITIYDGQRKDEVREAIIFANERKIRVTNIFDKNCLKIIDNYKL
jgi:hypothetical protein